MTARRLKGEVLPAARGPKLPRVRDIEIIDSELRLLLAIRHMVREAEGRPPSTTRIDELLDERAATSATDNDEIRAAAACAWWGGRRPSGGGSRGPTTARSCVSRAG